MADASVAALSLNGQPAAADVAAAATAENGGSAEAAAEAVAINGALPCHPASLPFIVHDAIIHAELFESRNVVQSRLAAASAEHTV